MRYKAHIDLFSEMNECPGEDFWSPVWRGHSNECPPTLYMMTTNLIKLSFDYFVVSVIQYLIVLCHF